MWPLVRGPIHISSLLGLLFVNIEINERRRNVVFGCDARQPLAMDFSVTRRIKNRRMPGRQYLVELPKRSPVRLDPILAAGRFPFQTNSPLAMDRIKLDVHDSQSLGHRPRQRRFAGERETAKDEETLHKSDLTAKALMRLRRIRDAKDVALNLNNPAMVSQ